MTSLRQEAANRQCTIRLDGCATEPCVLAHFRHAEWSGAAQKPVDLVAAWACSHCHDLLDRRKKMFWAAAEDGSDYLSQDEIDAAFGRGMARTLTALVQEQGNKPATLLQRAMRQGKGNTAKPARKRPSKGNTATSSKTISREDAR